MTSFRGARTFVIRTAVSGAFLGLVLIAQSPRAQIISYADGENRTAPIVIGATAAQLQVTTGTATQSGVISQSGNGTLQKFGGGTLILSAANTYSSQTTIVGGALNIQNNTALGATNGGAIVSGTTVGNGTALEMQGNITVGAESLLLNGTGIGGGGALRNISGDNTYGGAITLNNAVRINSDSGMLTLVNINVVSAGPNLTVGGAGDTTVRGVIATANGALTKDGLGTLTLMRANAYGGPTTVSAGVLNIRDGQALGFGGGGTTVANGAALELQQSVPGPSLVVSEALTLNGTGIANGGALRSISGNNTYIGTITLGSASRINSDAGTLVLNGFINGLGQNLTVGGTGDTVISSLAGIAIGAGSLTKDGTGTLTLTTANAYTGGTTISAGTLQIGNGGTTGSITGNVANDGVLAFNRSNAYTFAGDITGTGSLLKLGAGTLTLTGLNNSYSGGTTVLAGTLQGNTTSLRGDILNNANVTFDQLAESTGAYAGTMSGSGSLTKIGEGTLILTGNNTYRGGTIVSAGTLQGNTTSLQGNILNNTNVTFSQTFDGTYAGVMSGSGSLIKDGGGTLILTGANTYGGGTVVSAGTLQGNTTSLQGNILNNANVTFSQAFDGTYAGAMSGSGSLTKEGAGTLVLAGNNTYIGGTSVIGGRIAVNGSLTGGITIGSGGTLGGSGVISGSVANAGVIAPGNSIGTLTVNGNYTQAAGGTYQVEVNAAGQGDRLNVGGTAQLGGMVSVLAATGTYANSTTYTILNATAGVNGNYAGVTSNFAFLAPSLGYDSNNVYLTLTVNFANGGQTPNEKAVGGAIDAAAASGNFSNTMQALSVLDTLQGPAALNAISGQNYAGFSNVLVQRAQLFMNSFAAYAGGASGRSSLRTALAEACTDTTTCDTASPGWSVWASALGGTGTIAGNANAGTLTYNMMGFAAGLDRQFAPNLAVGVTVGYLGGSQWTGGFDGSGTSDGVLAALYALYRDGGFYLDAIAGYSYTENRLRRTIVIPGLSPRTATGDTGANQFFGQAEAGYRFDLDTRFSVTPFARLQGSTATQNGFTESGAESLNLSVAQQTTSSLRTVVGAQIGANLDLGGLEPLAVMLRLGWSHEYSDTARPVTATLAGAPFVPFTVQGAAPQRDGALIGFSADTAIAPSTSLYLRYEGNIAGQDSSHALALGVRLRW